MSRLDSVLSEQLTATFLRGLLSTPAGRAHLLNQAADAESSDENAIFERLLRSVDDPQLRRMIARHQADELRHAELLRECLARTGVDPGPVPAHLRLLERIDRHAGSLMAQPIRSAEDIMTTYLLLLVIEERAINQFSQFIPAFDRVDKQTADVFRGIAKDEERHLRYCHAISRRYAPDEATWQTRLDHFRALEAVAFGENGAANMAYVFQHGLHPAGALAQRLWLGINHLSTRAGRGPRTRYWGTSTLAGATAADA